MTDRQFKDCDGDVWAEETAGYLTCVADADGAIREHGRTETRSWVEGNYGPLTEIRPDVDVRLLLADVLEELADAVLEDYWDAADPTSERIYGRIAHRIRGRALKLREEAAG